MTIEDTTILITGANRGIGLALLQEALDRGAARVYATARGRLNHADSRVVPIRLDITDQAQISEAAAGIDDLDILINNAGAAAYDTLTDTTVLEQMLAVNFYGTRAVITAFVPALASGNGGAIVNNVSVNAFAALPIIASYSISKAATFNMTQTLRSTLADRNITVHAMMTGLVDTDMTAGLDVPKAAPVDVARATFDGLEAGQEEIFPDPMAQTMADGWTGGVTKSLEAQYAALYRQLSSA